MVKNKNDMKMQNGQVITAEDGKQYFVCLYFIRNSTVEVNTRHGMGFYSDVMTYAQHPPMNHVLTLSVVILLAGIGLTSLSLLITHGKK